MENPENGTPVWPSHPLTRVLVRPLRLFGEHPRLVLQKRRAKYGGDWPMRRVELETISTLYPTCTDPNLRAGLPHRLDVGFWALGQKTAPQM